MRVLAVDLVHDQLQCAVVELGCAADAHEIAVVEAAVQSLIGVPQHPGDRSGAIRQSDLQVQIAVAIGSQLLFRSQKDFVDRFVFTELTNETSRHAVTQPSVFISSSSNNSLSAGSYSGS